MKRNTKQREDVRDALQKQDGFVSAQDLHHVLKNEGSTIGLATVYRTLTALVDAEEADSISHGSETVYRACKPGHHHHLVCRECGSTTEIAAQAVEAWAREVAAEHGFIDPEHVVDIFGVCAECQKHSTGN